METIGVVGANCRHVGSEILARLSVPKGERVERLPSLAAEIGVSELVYVATCNRVEVAFKGDGKNTLKEYRRRAFGALTGREPRPGEADRTLHAWTGEGAVEHLFLVTSGLDSVQAGEHEIRTQVREALTMARRAGVSGTLLDFIVTQALQVALKVHQKVPVPGRRVSLADIAVEHLVDRLHHTPGRVAVVGVSPMTRHCAVALAGQGESVLVVNRTLATAEELALEIGGEPLSLAEFRSRPVAVEAVLVATGSPEILLGRPELEKMAACSDSGQPPLVVDMSVPPNTDRDAARITGTTLVEMDDILVEASVGRDQRLIDLAPAREIVDESLARLRQELAERLMSPIIARLTRRYRETAVEGVKRLFSKELENFDEAEREAVCRWAEVIARRFAHIPIKGLRGMAAEFGAQAVKTFLEASGEDLFPEEARALDQLEELAGMEA